jgi:hypothetical protein
VKIQLSEVETRDGVRYYARMRWTYTENHVRHVTRWTISGGYWQPSAIPVGRAAVGADPAGSVLVLGMGAPLGSHRAGWPGGR